MNSSNMQITVQLVDNKTQPAQFLTNSRTLLSDIQKTGANAVFADKSTGEQYSKSGVGIDINALLITFASAGVFSAAISLIRDWVLRREGRKVKISVAIENKKIEVEYSRTLGAEKDLQEFMKKIIKMIE
jgi:hypothetical protein